MNAEMKALLPAIQEQTRARFAAMQRDPAALRAASEELARPTYGTGPEIDRQYDTTIPGPEVEIPVRIFIPKGEVKGAYLYIHGGGWVLGSHTAQDPALRRICNGANVAIVSVGYRLAPEDPYPAGLDDCIAAADWLYEHASDLGASNTALAIGGGSAGGNLAAAALLRLRDEGRGGRFKAAILTFGVFKQVYDLPSMQAMKDKEIVLSGPIMQFFSDCYIPGGVDPLHPYISPFCADLHNMPPALFQVGTLDHLYSDSVVMTQKWKAAGNISEYFEYQDMPHGFGAYPQFPAGDQAAQRTIDFFARYLA